ncbi:ANTAR domain-containing response regulator [Planctobacterium marinum]|uniref:ANTAR domain-containing response regulator n=1 Tax=Planctobacterium marinum TaxID=1631968 RepID=UPI001E5E9DF8|nr:ANTAR domain-containing protein [Planctobacterium marinum]MCC2607110.1 ANTAR domain-containing protein [Planctobacterium marinum]
MAQDDHSQPLCVLLIDDDPQRATELSAALDKSRYQVKHMLGAEVSLLKQVDTLQPDVIIIDIESPSRDILDSLHTLNSFNPKPIVMFSEQEDTNTINQSVHSGVSAYVARDVSTTRVRAIMDAAVARFQQMQSLRNQLQETQQELASRKIIEKAKGLLMENRNLSEKEAYQVIRKMAMDNGLRMDQVAKNMIDIITTLSV